MNKIMIWSDFACPFCYIGERRLQDAIKELGWQDKFETTYKAFELDPNSSKKPSDVPVAERLARKYQLSIGEARERIESIDAQGRDVGIDFRYSSAKPSNTFDAHRLMKLAEAKYDKETVDKLNENLFAAYFTFSQVLADPAVLLEAGIKAGMKEDEIKELIDSDEYGEEVRKDEAEAASLGIHGVPYIVFNNKYAIPGALSIDDFKRVLEEIIDKEPIDDMAAKAKNCDENGCSL